VSEPWPGELAFSRREFNSGGLVEAKVVAEVFTEVSSVLHLHVDGPVKR
jgi:hypothetical protein